ncbi:glycosyltransferase [Cryomorpha ignava]|uniref:Glycosyltransferase n=1 Tax=Cryomorpha ignava TaxID=101383 RepID=A0A7K3WQV9_9FLAO|nr:glycosyltransferase [Cryomorpha ignava]NEN24063.1 glycosyltransferase [Cryomorpha ignava]
MKLKSSMANPLVSVIVLTYNHAAFIEQCLSSILDQESDFDFEIIVSDDSSTDSTSAKINKISQIVSLLHSHETEKNLGAARNFESAFAKCRGEYIAFCEGDDYWCDPKKLAKQIEILKNDSSATLVYANYGKVEESGKLIEASVLNPLKNSFGLHDFIDGHGPTIHSMVVRREIFPAKFPSAFFQVENPDVFIIGWALTKGRGAYIPETLSMYRIHESGIYASKTRTEKNLLRYATRMEFFGTMPLSYRSFYQTAITKFEESLARTNRNGDKRLFAKYVKLLPLGRRVIFGLRRNYYRARTRGK